jgi:hypothetical protein
VLVVVALWCCGRCRSWDLLSWVDARVMRRRRGVGDGF